MVQTRTSVFPPSLLCGDDSIALSGLILADLGQLDLIKKVSGSQREAIVREAFKDLLKSDPAVGSITLDTETTLRGALHSRFAARDSQVRRTPRAHRPR